MANGELNRQTRKGEMGASRILVYMFREKSKLHLVAHFLLYDL